MVTTGPHRLYCYTLYYYRAVLYYYSAVLYYYRAVLYYFIALYCTTIPATQCYISVYNAPLYRPYCTTVQYILYYYTG